ncbi:WecB/TagA/CpsF family glycosyltransferase [candidate division WWE3 bacterium]|uniref:WecB/TagA/CpsF family glycosyltransferase n=1 Tax=candidate division WWE3 bacterium TaxID=2053526 RepID=A0A955LJU7_UNCKA|nr:WecB/TagA/CpsF family glycosyltransferase [candidate division WWE3 bacterium]
MMVEKVKILNTEISAVTLNEAVELVIGLIKEGGRFRYVVTPNPEMILEALGNKDFASALNSASLAIPDGSGVVVASAYTNREPRDSKLLEFVNTLLGFVVEEFKYALGKRPSKLTERVAGVDLVEQVLSADFKIKIYLLGGANGVASAAADQIQNTYPNAEVVGYSSGGAIDKSGLGDNDEEVVNEINALKPDLLLIAFGAPKQEMWIVHNKNRLQVSVAIGVGGTLDFFTGVQKRAPDLLQRLGLEWVWRLIGQPARVGRIFKALVIFPYYMTLNRLRMIKSNHVPQV